MSTPPKISLKEFKALINNADTPNQEIAKYIVINDETSSPRNPSFKPNSALVKMTMEELEQESTMDIGNDLMRTRRHLRFNTRRSFGSKRPVLVSEGDSWFQFPLLIDEVIDHLDDDYDIWCVSAAGDTVENMVYGPKHDKGCEYLQHLQNHKDTVRAFLFSGAGNDIIGEDENNVPVLFSLLKDFQAGTSAKDLIDWPAFNKRLAKLKDAYSLVIENVRAVPELKTLPIIIHGYDHPYPYPGNSEDPRNPIYAKKDEWLGGPLSKRNIVDPSLRREIITIMIDSLYDLLGGLVQQHSHVHVVDVRKTLTKVTDWNDEIHGTSEGFGLVAAKFKAVLQAAGV